MIGPSRSSLAGRGGRGGAQSTDRRRGCAGRRADRRDGRPAGSVCPLLHPRSGDAARRPRSRPRRGAPSSTRPAASSPIGRVRCATTRRRCRWLPDRGALVLASWPALRGHRSRRGRSAPVPLLDNGVDAVPAGEWDIRWDESGHAHRDLAADAGQSRPWAAEPADGRRATGASIRDGIALHDAPALAGFSIGNDRLAWATPPGQDGEGSRLQVLAWSGANAGKIDSQPVSGRQRGRRRPLDPQPARVVEWPVPTTRPRQARFVARAPLASAASGRDCTIRRDGLLCADVRRQSLVASVVLTAALVTLVALPGVAGSQTPSTGSPIHGRSVPGGSASSVG